MLSLVFVLLAISFVSAEYSLDIKFDKPEYSSGDELVYRVLLLEDGKQISDQVTIYFSDALDRKQITKTVTSNEDNTLLIEDDFASGGWKVRAEYKDKTIESRPFFIKANVQVEFQIKEDTLVIINKGNTPYQKQIQIIIGDDITPQSINLGVGKTKELKLVAPEGNYDIKVTDGENTITKKAVYLTGTGNVVGAYDESLLSGGIIGGVNDPDKEGFFFSGKRTPIALVFVGAVMALGILFFIERRLNRKAEA